jgi:lipopolysaccharide/colanic/teichoic acid biosynthesis glycosyltransferase
MKLAPAVSAARSAETPRTGVQVPRWKRCLDIFLILLASPLLLALGALLALAIKTLSPGPILFRQWRIGLAGKPFLCLKFRTMVVNADTHVHEGHLSNLITSNAPMTKLDSADPRLIPYGRILRSLGLDELPQIFNILRGEMSLVGPRPCLPYEYDRYLPHHRRRCDTLPGLTGLWQVNGKNRTTFEEMMDLDIHYAKNKSISLDLLIIAKTIPAILVQTWEIRRKKSGMKSAPMPVRPAPNQAMER